MFAGKARAHRGVGVAAVSLAALALVWAQEPASPATGVTDREPARNRVQPSTREMAALLAERAATVDPTALWFNVNDIRAELMAKELERLVAPGARSDSGGDGGSAPVVPDVGAPELVAPRWTVGLLSPSSSEGRRVIDLFKLRYAYASELAYTGRYGDALVQTDSLLQMIDEIGPRLPADVYINLLMMQATTFLRMGEEQNCAEGYNRDTCLLPIRGGGIHERKEGSTRAAAILERVLRIDPGNLRARWLLNVAHMTLGSYPDGVPAAALVPPSAFEAEYPLPRFDNVAVEVGLDIYGLSGGAVVDDFDNDGLLDVMVSAVGFDDQTRLFRNDGAGRFEDVTATSGLTGLTGGLNMVQADYDNDGLVDVVVLRGGWMGRQGRFPLSLLRNLGDFRFQDVTKEAGLVRLAPTQTAAWLDYNGDGWLDLFVGNESTVDDRNPCELFRSNGDGTFSEMAREVGLDVLGYVKGVVSGDFNNDGRPDLYLSLAQAPNMLFRNDGQAPHGTWRFTEVAAEAGVTEPRASFPAMFFDYDDDGWLDLYVAAYYAGAEDVAADYLDQDTAAERGRLYRNSRDGTFNDVTERAGLDTVMPVMGLNFGDLDGDGWLDFYTGTGNPDFSTLVPNRMFRNDEGRRFQDVTTAGNFGHLQKGHAVAFGDVDNDGDQDVFEQMGGAYQADRAYSALYENPGTANGWVSLELEGVKASRSAIGARLKIELQTPGGTRDLHRTVGSGGSFGAAPLRVEIGIGDAPAIRSLEVRWPGSGIVEVFRDVAPGRHYRIVEGRGVAEPVKRPRVTLARGQLSQKHAHE